MRLEAAEERRPAERRRDRDLRPTSALACAPPVEQRTGDQPAEARGDERSADRPGEYVGSLAVVDGDLRRPAEIVAEGAGGGATAGRELLPFDAREDSLELSPLQGEHGQ